jgi:hypothetical protein
MTNQYAVVTDRAVGAALIPGTGEIPAKMCYPAVLWEDLPTLGARTILSATSSAKADAGGDARAPKSKLPRPVPLASKLRVSALARVV